MRVLYNFSMPNIRKAGSFKRYMEASKDFKRALEFEVIAFAQGRRDKESFALSLAHRERMQELGDALNFSDPSYVEKHARLLEEEAAKAHNASLRK